MSQSKKKKSLILILLMSILSLLLMLTIGFLSGLAAFGLNVVGIPWPLSGLLIGSAFGLWICIGVYEKIKHSKVQKLQNLNTSEASQ